MIAVAHTAPPIGQTLSFYGSNYMVTNVVINNTLNVAIIQVNGKFPNGSWIGVRSNTNVLGLPFYLTGFGPQRGPEVTTVVCPSYPLVLTNFACLESCNRFEVTGGDVDTQIVIQCRTNYCSGEWITMSNATITSGEGCHIVDVPRGFEQSVFYRAMATNLKVITNGWEHGIYDGVLRWGTNTVEYVDPYGIPHSTFDGTNGASECTTGPFDSGGPGFIKGSGMKYELALMVNSGDEGPYRVNGSNVVSGPIFDMRGLTLTEQVGNEFVDYWTFNPRLPQPVPAVTKYVNVALAYQWLKANKFIPNKQP
jgi:hypothetical protein